MLWKQARQLLLLRNTKMPPAFSPQLSKWQTLILRKVLQVVYLSPYFKTKLLWEVLVFSGEKLASSYIQQGLYSHALKVLSGIKSSQKILITKLLLALNLKLHSHGESKLSQNIQTTLEESKGSFHPPQLQHALDSLVGGHQIDESLVPTLWQYLNSDQKQLFVCLLSNV